MKRCLKIINYPILHQSQWQFLILIFSFGITPHRIKIKKLLKVLELSNLRCL